MKVVLVSNTLQGFIPDVYAPMTTAEQVGQLQAKQLVSKLELDKTSSDNPKHIEVLLPYDAADESGSTADATFAQDVFKGIWSVLGPYFKEGKAVSPSGTLTSSSTESDWASVAFDAAKANGSNPHSPNVSAWTRTHRVIPVSTASSPAMIMWPAMFPKSSTILAIPVRRPTSTHPSPFPASWTISPARKT